jgi:hypothetical protein
MQDRLALQRVWSPDSCGTHLRPPAPANDHKGGRSPKLHRGMKSSNGIPFRNEEGVLTIDIVVPHQASHRRPALKSSSKSRIHEVETRGISRKGRAQTS